MGEPAHPDAAASRATDTGWFRQVLGQYPTIVSVVTGVAADGTPAGMAVGSFTSVSLDPPLVAFLPDKKSSSWPKIAPAGRFCVNILADDQEPVCRAFASKAPDKFAGLRWRPAASGSPILENAVAWVDCDLEAVHDAGDHLIVLGRVTDLDVERPTLPLLFFQGGYGRFSPHSLAIRDARFRTQLHLVDRARPLMEKLSERTGAQVAAAYCDGSELTVLASVGAPADPRVSPAVIGQHLPVVAPWGIWWMAFADAAHVERWLGGIESADLRAAIAWRWPRSASAATAWGWPPSGPRSRRSSATAPFPANPPTRSGRSSPAWHSTRRTTYHPAATRPSPPSAPDPTWSACGRRRSPPRATPRSG